MARKSINHQPSLFDAEPCVTPCPTHMIELRGLLEGLVREIAQALVNVRRAEDSHEQDHG
ncbi:hypothetical protein WSK_1997 [Novosphingobium sp. Rr 2-17]|uniref:hypothetical protein n=1 Tax=Novosphingobium sp. Rr 2-17 TaxID=555793 RepID=UPI000269850A|nr:hypothetical protein [Novosphingobium sp. Rr 2-17]EIZ79417.1 hypothetical protein WSK_1997 [Novosphingobium sp. Rr 2-17]